MKKAIYLSSFLLFLFTACEKDYIGTAPVDLNAPVSFSKDIAPMLNTNCAKSGCHITGQQSPDLTTVNAYDQLLQLGYVDTTNSEQSIVYLRITSTTKPMPPSGKLDAASIGSILAWIKQGAQNN